MYSVQGIAAAVSEDGCETRLIREKGTQLEPCRGALMILIENDHIDDVATRVNEGQGGWIFILGVAEAGQSCFSRRHVWRGVRGTESGRGYLSPPPFRFFARGFTYSTHLKNHAIPYIYFR